MKIKSKSKILIIIVAIFFIVVAGFVLAKQSEVSKERIVTRDYSNVYFEKAGNDPTKINVYLGMKDLASISGFQIGLEIDIADCYDAQFDWSTGSLKDESVAKLREVKVTEKEKDEVTGNQEENMNLYYVGTTELNNLDKNTDIDHIKLGTINIVPKKGDNNEDIPTRSSYINIQTRDDGFSKTESLSFNSEAIKVIQDEAYTGSIGVKQAPIIDQLVANVEAQVNEETQTEGAKIVVNFELKDDTNALTSLTVDVIGEDGNVKYTKTIDDIKNIQLPITFDNVEIGTYTVQIKGTYTLDDEIYQNQLLQTSVGDDAEVTGVVVATTDEPMNPEESTGSGNSGNNNQGGSTGTEGSGNNKPSDSTGTEGSDNNNPNNPGAGDSGNQNGTTGNNTNKPTDETSNSNPSQNSNNKGNNSSVNGSSLNTGANHSLTRFILPLAILIIIVIVLLYLKSKVKAKKSKH